MQEKIKIVIVDEQHDYRNSCAERLSELGYEIAASTSNPIKALDIIKETQPDVVLFDIVLSPIDGIAFLRSCASLQKKPHMIAVSSIISDIVIRESMQYGAEYYIIKPFDFNILDERIKRMCGRSASLPTAQNEEHFDTNEVDLESQVTSLILEIGIPAHVKGYHYVRTAIIMAVENPDTINAVTKIVYPTIAKKYQTSSSRVERAIRHAIEVAWDRGDIDVLNGIFGYSINGNRGKPTNSEFIAMLADQLRLKNKQTNAKISLRI
ncbi:MAG: sporulation transcription factor Spo0A [Clostridia bacterium]|nr:sporulation transcription factor Spo0A [Clostridia bacterium]